MHNISEKAIEKSTYSTISTISHSEKGKTMETEKGSADVRDWRKENAHSFFKAMSSSI